MHISRIRRALRRLSFAAAALVALLPVLSGAFAQDDRQTVRVGYYENEMFQEGAREGAVKTGYGYEYYRKISEYTGWKYEYVYGTFGETYRMLLDGEVDLLAGLAWREEREGLIGYPNAAMGSESYALIKHESDRSVTGDPATLAGLRFGVLDSAIVGVLQEYLDGAGVEAQVVPFSSAEELSAAFDSHEIDILAAESDGAYGREGAQVVCVFGYSDYYLCVNVQRPDLLARLNEAQAMLNTEEPNYIGTLRTKYYPVSVFSRMFSDAERDWLDAHSVLRIGYLENYLPYSDTDKDGAVTGAVKDIVPAMLENLGLSVAVTYRGYPNYDAMVLGMLSGEIDAAFPVGGGLYYSEENGIYQSNPVLSSSADLVYRGEYTEDTASHFAVNSNNRMQYYYVLKYFPEAQITFYPSIDECLEAVLAGKAGCTTLNGLRANGILENGRYRKLSMRQLGFADDCCFGVEIGNEGLLKLLNRGISVTGTEVLRAAAYRYTSALSTRTVWDLVLENMGLFGSILMVMAALVIFFLARGRRRARKEVREKEIAAQALAEKNEELDRSRNALSDALASAEQASRAKTTFLNNMSHDIRTPMNAIVGFTALAASHIDNREQVRDYLGKISVSSRHLLSLINDVLDMSRIESGRMTLEETDVHLPDLIRDLRTIVQANASAKNLQLFFDTRDVSHEDIRADRLRLNQVLLNILSNAVKFTPDGGTIAFRVVEKPCETPGRALFEFTIRDSGIGMSPEFQPSVFDAFSREKNTTVSGIQGTGLGMAITKNIVDMMGGEIRFTSEEGKGTEFVVEVSFTAAQSGAEGPDLSRLKGIRALVADDDTDSCLSVCGMLRDIGMRGEWTNYGKEAVLRAKEALGQADPFRVYIIDWMMPDQDGIETVRQIRAAIGDDTPIIILTAYDWADIEEEARLAGVTAFCSKPVFPSELRSLLSSPEGGLSPAPDDAAPDFTGKTVLLAEDNAMNQLIATEILRGVGFEVEIANDGAEAVEIVERAPAGTYDAVLMDIQMPRMDGYEASRRIRALEDERKARVPIVAVTANAFEEDRRAAADAGMNGHLAKPYDIPQILATLKELLGGR